MKAHLPLKMFTTKLSQTSYSLTVHEFSTGTCVLIYLFISHTPLRAIVKLTTAKLYADSLK